MEDAFFNKEIPGGRGLDAVSHFFLSDRDVPDIPPRREGPGEGSTREGEGNTVPAVQSEVCIILCPDGFVPQGSFLGCMLAFSLAACNVSVGLIETTTRLPYTFFLSGGYENLDAVFWESNLDLPEFSNIVARFRKTCDYVLITVAASALMKRSGPAGATPAEWMGSFLVPTTVRPQDLLSAYGIIKNASKRWAMAEIKLVVIKQQSTDNAAGAAVVLEKMAGRFLPCSVRFVGAVTLSDGIDPSGGLSLTPSLQALPDAFAEALKGIVSHLMLSGSSRKLRKTAC